MAKELSITDKANKENWRVLKHSSDTYSCECLCGEEYVHICFRRNLQLAKSEIDAIVYKSLKTLNINTTPDIVVDYSQKKEVATAVSIKKENPTVE